MAAVKPVKRDHLLSSVIETDLESLHLTEPSVGFGFVDVAMGIAIMTGSWTVLMSRMLAFHAGLGWPPI